MDIEQAVEKKALIFRLRGELDLKTAPELREAIDRSLTTTRAHDVVVNLSHVTFVDSSGIGVLLGRYKEVSQARGQLVIAGPQPHVRTVLDLSGVGRVIPLVNDEQEALELLETGRGNRHV